MCQFKIHLRFDEVAVWELGGSSVEESIKHYFFLTFQKGTIPFKRSVIAVLVNHVFILYDFPNLSTLQIFRNFPSISYIRLRHIQQSDALNNIFPLCFAYKPTTNNFVSLRRILMKGD